MEDRVSEDSRANEVRSREFDKNAMRAFLHGGSRTTAARRAKCRMHFVNLILSFILFSSKISILLSSLFIFINYSEPIPGLALSPFHGSGFAIIKTEREESQA